MKTATVRELRNHYSAVLKWIEAGEEVKNSRRGKVIARLVPERQKVRGKIDWSTSAAVLRDKTQLPFITAEQRAEILDYNKGSW